MRKLSFKKLWIVSDREQSARIEEIADAETVVTSRGLNRTGKSSFIKSLYMALGADPTKNNLDWESLETKLLMEFSVDGETFFSLRVGQNIALFDSSTEAISIHYGVTKSSEAWGKLLSTQVQFPSARGQLMSAWPSALFLPFYIDQDTGLSETWNSFGSLGAYKNHKDTLIDFHTGVRPKEYYQCKAVRDEAVSVRKEREAERGHLEFAQSKLHAKTLDSDLTFDAKVFQAEIEKYLELQNHFNELREKVRLDIRELQAKRSRLHQEKKLAAATLKELDADVAYLNRIDTSEIICPTCNTMHETSFANTLRLTGDAETCRAYLDRTLEEIEKLSNKILKKTESLNGHEHQILEIDSILGERRGELTLKSMLEHESRRVATVNLETEKSQIDEAIGKINEDVRVAEDEMKEFSSSARKKTILEFYQAKLRAFCNDLNVSSPPDKMFEKLRPAVNDTGSELPRLLLAYQYAILHTVSEFSTAIFAPIVLDTVQHQDQSETNLKAMIEFAFKKRPAGTQLIFGAVDMPSFAHDGNLIIADTYRQLLLPTAYQEAKEYIAPFVAQLFSDKLAQSSVTNDSSPT